MEFFDVVSRRYSHRTAFLDQPVPDADVRRIVEAGIQAPSGQNCQTTSFVVVTDPELRKGISELLSTPATQTAPVILVVLSEHVVAPCGMSFEVEDYAAAVGLDKKGAGEDISVILLERMGHAVPHRMPKAQLLEELR